MKAIEREEQTQLQELRREAREVVAVGPSAANRFAKSTRYWDRTLPPSSNRPLMHLLIVLLTPHPQNSGKDDDVSSRAKTVYINQEPVDGST